MGKSAGASSTGAPPSTMSSSANNNNNNNNDPSDNKHEQRLQAVLLADTFSNAFYPITLEPYHSSFDTTNNSSNANSDASKRKRPLLLCPINNVPLLNHTIDFLQGNGVEELFILVAMGAEALEEYIRCHAEGSTGGMMMNPNSSNHDNNRMSTKSSSSGGGGENANKIAWSSNLMISIVRITDCTNAGDALRELDRRNVIKSDPFILMQGDVVTNVDLHQAMECHSQRKKKDAAAIMTVLLKDVGGWGLDDDIDDEDIRAEEDKEEVEENAIQDEEKKDDDNDGFNQELRNTTTTTNLPKSNSFLPPLRSSTDDLLVALDTTHSNRILLWDSHPHNSNAFLPSIFFHENSSNITLSRNYLDVGIDICSPDVLARFSDEFDYRELREQFVANCVSEEESGLQSARIYAHMLNTSGGEYAGRPLGDMRRYHQVSMDLLRRWCYPLVPDNYHHRGWNIVGGDGNGGFSGGSQVIQRKSASYVRERHFIYRDVLSTAKAGVGMGADPSTSHNRSHLGRSTQLLGPLLLGPNNSIGERCMLQRSVLGPNCTILDDCSIVDCHLWGNNIVEEGVVLEGVIVCEGAIIRKGAMVERGCVVGEGCIVGKGVRLKEFTRITCAAEVDDEDDDDYSGFSGSSDSDEDSEDNDDDDDNQETKSNEAAEVTDIATDHGVVGDDGIGRVYIPAPSDDYDSDDDKEEAETVAMELMKSQSIGYDMKLIYQKWKKLQMEDEDDGFSLDERDSDEEDSMMYMDEEWTNDDAAATNMRSSVSNSHLGEDGMQITGRQKGVDVVKELRDICLEHETSTPVENLRIELNSFKFSQNATYADCCTGAMMAVMEKILEESDKGSVPTPGKLVGSLKKMLEYWGVLFHSICMGLEEEKAIIYTLETLAVGPAEGRVASALIQEPAFRFVLQTLHDQEIVNEEAIFAWASERKGEGKDSPFASLFWQKPTQDFLEWLNEDDSSEEGDDDSDSD